jgi:16S rRNA C1402 (ribose-2'-O) methylase RsmI
MGTTNAPSKVIKECDAILSGDLVKTQEQLNRWMVVQLRKLAVQSAHRHTESKKTRQTISQLDRFTKGGL